MNLFGFKEINEKIEKRFSHLLKKLEDDYVLEIAGYMVEVNKYF